MGWEHFLTIAGAVALVRLLSDLLSRKRREERRLEAGKKNEIAVPYILDISGRCYKLLAGYKERDKVVPFGGMWDARHGWWVLPTVPEALLKLENLQVTEAAIKRISLEYDLARLPRVQVIETPVKLDEVDTADHSEYWDVYDEYWERRELRQAVIKRDKNKCQICGAIGEQVHHRIPRSKGGTDDLNNLVLLCTKCHIDKHPSLKGLIISNAAKFSYSRLLEIRRVRFKKRVARNEYLCYICKKTIYPYDEYYYGRKNLYSAPLYNSRYPTFESSASVHLCVSCVVKYKNKLLIDL